MPFQKLYKNSFNHLIFKINIITGEPGGYRLALFAFMFALATALTLYTINKSKALSDFLEMMADERQSLGRKLVALVKAWWLRGKSSRS